MGPVEWQPHLKLNRDRDELVTLKGYNAVELGGGVVAKFNDRFSLHLTADYIADTGDAGRDRETVEGNPGLRVCGSAGGARPLHLCACPRSR